MKNRIKDLKLRISYLQETCTEMKENGVKPRRVRAILNSYKKELAELEKQS